MKQATSARFPAGARPYRLTGTGAFDAVFRDGARFDARQVQIIAMPAAHAIGRFGVVVGRKALPRAIDRNRFKRLVREALRRLRERAVRFDVIVRLKEPVGRSGIDAAARDAVELLERSLATMETRRAP